MLICTNVASTTFHILIIISRQRTTLKRWIASSSSSGLSHAIIECPLSQASTATQTEMIKNKNMLISINTNLIKFSTYLKNGIFSLARWINFQFRNVSNFHYSGLISAVFIFRSSSIVNCNFRFSCKMVFSLVAHRSIKLELGEGQGQKWFITHWENPHFVISSENKFQGKSSIYYTSKIAKLSFMLADDALKFFYNSSAA